MKKIPALVLLLACAHAWGVPAIVQSATGHGTSTTCAVTLNSVAAGDAIIWHGFAGTASPSFVSIADSSGNTVSAVPGVGWTTNPSPAESFGAYYVQNTSSGTHTITLTVSASETSTCAASEWSGLATSGVADVASTIKFTASSSSVSSNSITPSANGELVMFLVGQESNLTYSAYNNSFVQQYSSAAMPTVVAASEIQATAAAISGAATSSAAASYATVVAAFVPATPPTSVLLENGKVLTESGKVLTEQ